MDRRSVPCSIVVNPMKHPARKAYSFAGLALLAVGIAASCTAGGEDTKHSTSSGTGATSSGAGGAGGDDTGLTVGNGSGSTVTRAAARR